MTPHRLPKSASSVLRARQAPELINLAEHQIHRKQVLGGLTREYYAEALPPRVATKTQVTTPNRISEPHRLMATHLRPEQLRPGFVVGISGTILKLGPNLATSTHNIARFADSLEAAVAVLLARPPEGSRNIVTMRVAQFSYEYPPLSTGGMGTYLKGLVNDHRRRGAYVDLYFVGPAGPAEPHIWTPAFESQIYTYSLSDLLERGGSADYDVVVCQDWPGVLVSQPLWKRGIPLVYTCHLPLAWDIGEFDDIPSPASAELEFLGVASADLIIACSAATEDALLQQYPFVAGKTMVIHNGAHIDLFKRTNGPAQLPSQPAPVLAFVGRYVEQKGFDRLPEIFEVARSLVPELQLEIMGIGPLEAAVRCDFDARGLSHAVTWHSFGDPLAVRTLLWEATVVTIPSRLEPFGLIATEAMAAGCAVVSSLAGGLGEFLTDNVTGLLIPPDNVQGFGLAIARLVTDRELASRLGQAASRHAAARFSQRRCCRRTFDAYTDLVRRGPM